MTTATKNRITTNGSASHGKSTSKEVVVALQPIQVKTFDITIVGTSELIVHKFSEKAKKSIEDKQQKKSKQGKEARDPRAEYLAAFYMLPDSPAPETKKARYGIPAAGFKNAAVSACRFVDGMQMTVARGAFHVVEDAGGLIEIHSESGPYMREDTVRLSGPGNSLDLRYRPAFPDWQCTFRVRYNATVVSPEQIINLFNVAGFGVGLCEWRPEKNGSYGMFSVQMK